MLAVRSQVQQQPLTAASQHNRQHTEQAGRMAKRPAAPLVRDEEACLTPKVDTNDPGLRWISMDRGSERFQAGDCAGHPEWILQADGQCSSELSAIVP
jgi:hypothetical protein